MTDARTTDERTAISPPREPSATTGILAFAAEDYLPEIQRALG
jgi:hypothetical protein